MIRAKLGLLALFLFLGATAFGCARGGGEPGDSLTSDDLVAMALLQEDLGEEYAALQIADDSGPTDNAQAAEDTIDPDDTEKDLSERGRRDGYDLTYRDPNLAAVDAGMGVIDVGTSIDLFEDDVAAAGFLAKQLADLERSLGAEVESGVTLAGVETFDVLGLANEAHGMRSEAQSGGVALFGTVVAFRRGRIVGAAFVTRADDADVRGEAERIARALDRRIEGVLRAKGER